MNSRHTNKGGEKTSDMSNWGTHGIKFIPICQKNPKCIEIRSAFAQNGLKYNVESHLRPVPVSPKNGTEFSSNPTEETMQSACAQMVFGLKIWNICLYKASESATSCQKKPYSGSKAKNNLWGLYTKAPTQPCSVCHCVRVDATNGRITSAHLVSQDSNLFPAGFSRVNIVHSNWG